MTRARDRRRASAAALVRALRPLIEQHFEGEPAPEKKTVVVPADRRLVEAAAAVTAAVTRLQQVKYTAAEGRARMSLERAALALRTACPPQGDRHG